jgi:hypothetical protein
MKKLLLLFFLCISCTIILGQPITPIFHWPNSISSTIERYNPPENIIPNKYGIKKYGVIKKKTNRNKGNFENTFTASTIPSKSVSPQVFEMKEIPIDFHDVSDPYLFSNPNPNFFMTDPPNGNLDPPKDSTLIKENNIRYNAEFYRDRGKFRIYSGIGCQVISAIIVFSNTTLEIHNKITISNGQKITVSNSILTTKSDAATYAAGGFALVGVILEISGIHNIKKSNLYLKSNGLVWKF